MASEETYIRAAERRGWVFLGPIPEQTKDLTNWRCYNKHYVRMALVQVMTGRRCPQCI